ncbi:non-ribosomal peptide synthetase [Streptomyces sp. MZ04]|uniref:non-ribosomal peptide synthetase n=1 Tax=Streptomyces sp. MZ04 TaxID=2559236 RepID=UPI00107E70D2|nr:non-ribosomal peptide synthetase [Streptomyces sp. MZ04]TGB14630.1 amino acid adenylation domain-containing protein [Streptomyces sp. MZ04]
MFEAQALRTPDATAVVYDTTAFTYRELNERSNQLARLLIARGAGPEERVALVLPRSAETLIAILGVSKAGAAWVPVDPGYPEVRIAGLLDSSRPLLALATRDTAAALPAGTDVVVLDGDETSRALAGQAADDVADTERRAPLIPDHAAYIIHTSGSTGAPKGVVVSHRGLASLAVDHIERFGIVAGDGVLQFASFNFDCSVGDMVMAFASGASLIVRPEECLSGHQLGDLIERTGATHVTIPPQVLAALPPAAYPTLKSIATAGDVLTAELVSLWAPGRRMFNAYGPTEATVDALATEVTAGPSVPPIGRPTVNNRAYVLDDELRPVPDGESGELFIAGAGLARGYRGQPGLTAERFLPCPFGGPGERMYRTGDVVRRRPDGNLEFLGRVDEQVKIRGFRIEPGEIETVLSRHAAVSASVVVARDDGPGGKRLVAYAVAAPGAAPDHAELRGHLAAELPDYLVPSAVVVLDAFPLNTNGKLDRRALPSPELSARTSGRAPSTPREELLCSLFTQVLGLDRVGIDDRFFDLGGDSILAIQLSARARQAGWVLEPADVFAHQSVVDLAPLVEPVARPASSGAEEPEDALGPVPVTPPVIRAGTFANRPALSWQSAVIDLPADRDPRWFAPALRAVIDHHGALRLQWDDDARQLDARVLPPGAVDVEAAVQEAWISAADADAAVTEKAILSAAAALDPARARVLCAVQLHAEEVPPRLPRLALVAHRLVVDRTSWDVLLTDLETAWAALQAGEPVVLAPAGTSYRRWARHAAEEATGTDVEARAVAARMLPDSAPGTDGPGTERGAPRGELTVRLTAETSGPLLTSVPEAFRAEPQDMLLTGLALAVAEWHRRTGWSDSGNVLLDLEDDGRAAFAPGVDLRRTVGLLADARPVAFDMALGTGLPAWDEVRSGGVRVGEAIKCVKEQVRSHAAPEPSGGGAPWIGFRHRGGGTETAGGQLPVPQAEFGGELMIPGHALEVTTVVRGPSGAPLLDATWTWLPGDAPDDAATELAALWVEAVEGIALHGSRPDAGGHTPSDLPLVSLSQDEIDDLVSEWE